MVEGTTILDSFIAEDMLAMHNQFRVAEDICDALLVLHGDLNVMTRNSDVETHIQEDLHAPSSHPLPS